MTEDERNKAIEEAVQRCARLEQQVQNLTISKEELKTAIDNMVAILGRAITQMTETLPKSDEKDTLVVEDKVGRIHIMRPWRKR